MRMRAFRVSCFGFEDRIYFAQSRDAARHAALSLIRECGCRYRLHSDVHARRAPEFDTRTVDGKRPTTGTLPESFDPRP